MIGVSHVSRILEEIYSTLSTEGTDLQEIYSQIPLAMGQIECRLFLGVHNRFVRFQFQLLSHTTPTLQAMRSTSKQ